MKIFIINLEKDKDRFSNITKQLKKYNCNYERINAVNGNSLYPNNTNLTNAQLGCYLSHIKTVEAIYNQNLDNAIILEDDVTLAPNFNEIFNLKLPDNFDICWIGVCRGKWPRNPCSIYPSPSFDNIEIKPNQLFYPIINDKNVDENVDDDNYPVGGYGLIISKKGAEKILKMKHNFIKPIDMLYVKEQSFEKYMTIPSFVIHCYDFGSNITGEGLINNNNTIFCTRIYYIYILLFFITIFCFIYLFFHIYNWNRIRCN
jgi:GR25 family glycosyltransferase involved in LPS biosynthesis